MVMGSWHEMVQPCSTLWMFQAIQPITMFAVLQVWGLILA